MTSFFESWEKWSPQMLSIVRIIAAACFIQHGLQKFFGFPAPGPATLSTLFIVQGFLEAVGGLLLLLGVYTRAVAFILAGDMAVAYFMVHFPKSFFPLVNGGDLAILFCFIFFYIVFVGGGAWSIDRKVLHQE
ncbi:MAG: DoxX family protein [Hyphomicrobiales bacterium]|nr:DoxX family protein [Hyphomicrobiales bacterium]